MKQPEFHSWNSYRRVVCLAITAWALAIGSSSAVSKEKETLPSPGLVREFTASLDEVRKAILDIQHDQIIHGTLMFDKQPILTGAEAVEQTALFEP